MADAVATKVTYNEGRRYAAHFTNESDSTGESAVAKIDISALTDSTGATCTSFTVDRIEYSVWGFNYVLVYWDHTSDVKIAVLSGQGVEDWTAEGGNQDTGSGGTGDVTFTTDGGADGSGYESATSRGGAAGPGQ